MRPLQNRVNPLGELIADPARGSLMGNRGCLHDEHGQIRRHHRGKLWIFCRLEFKGRWRPPTPPNRYTALFFLDEATAFAAGHRPCGECMHGRYIEFRDAWATANLELAKPRASASVMNEILHTDRIDAHGKKVTFRAMVGDLPDGTFILRPDARGGRPRPKLIWAGQALTWTPAGYGQSHAIRDDEIVDVLTPASTARTFATGFRPSVAWAAPPSPSHASDP